MTSVGGGDSDSSLGQALKFAIAVGTAEDVKKEIESKMLFILGVFSSCVSKGWKFNRTLIYRAEGEKFRY